MAFNCINDYILPAVPFADEPVTLTEVKAYGKIDYSTDDNLLQMMIPAARQRLEEYLSLSFVQRDITVLCNNGSGGLLIPFGPMDPSTLQVFYEGETTATDPANVKISGLGNYRLIYPAVCGLTLKFKGGYLPGQLPEAFKTALCAEVLYMTENRGDDRDQTLKNICPDAVQLLAPFRLYNKILIY